MHACSSVAVSECWTVVLNNVAIVGKSLLMYNFGWLASVASIVPFPS